ncbi:MAG: phosphate transport system permease protein [Actinomycetota bacterium]|nr:phosphate transport system permease protein [Actinomycetota bacterium]
MSIGTYDSSNGRLPPSTVPTSLADPSADRPRKLQTRTFDDVACLVGAAAGSLGLVWLLYERVLPFSGILGFVVCWYVAFLVLYAGVTAISNPKTAALDRLVAAIAYGGAALVGLALVSAVGFIFAKAWPALHHLNFYTKDMTGVRPTSPLNRGGVIHAVTGSAIEVGIAVVFALPLGVGAAVYMTEVGGRLANTVRIVIEAMTALPDIVAGLFVYVLLIIGLGVEKSGIAVSAALVVTMTPITARSAEVVLKVVSSSLREAGLALGASQWQTVRRVVLPTARPGLATALILGIARIVGETAPLLIVTGASTFLNRNPFHNPMTSLPLFIFSAVRSGEPVFIQRAYGAAALLLALVLVLFSITRVLARTRQGSR